MKIAVVASNGKASKAIIAELIARDHAVTAFARGANQSAAKEREQKCSKEFRAEGHHGPDEGRFGRI